MRSNFHGPLDAYRPAMLDIADVPDREIIARGVKRGIGSALGLGLLAVVTPGVTMAQGATLGLMSGVVGTGLGLAAKRFTGRRAARSGTGG